MESGLLIKKTVVIESEFFKTPGKSMKHLLRLAGQTFALFLDKEAAIMEKIEQP